MIAGFMKTIKKNGDNDPKPLATLTTDELANILEQDRLSTDALKIHKMLLMTYRTTFHNLRTKYKLPEECMFDKKTGEFFKKEEGNG